ncbi:PIR Superfamily Protein [Plasmodium ovale curtisi]|uniref:PIR Superfamily Protein n=1 Tax=Plasmodium ovale curtisi TaxID=864141 RepID=A0A1A8XE53_PLAOA|nr:PIR Superfamily Protein [Plasmodium ovale curtisi]
MANENVVEDALKLLEQNENFTSKSNLFKLYKILNESYGTHILTPKCNKVSDLKVIQRCRSMEQIMNSWNNIILPLCNSEVVKESKCCDYLIQWLYGKLIDGNFNYSNSIWIYNAFWNILKIKCYNGNDNEFYLKKIYDKKALKTKKELFDFVEYYHIIKDILSSENATNNEKYLKYIKYIVDLFKETQNQKCSTVYKYEIEHFEKEIIDKEEAFNFLNRKCPDIKSHLDLIKINRITCPEPKGDSPEKSPKLPASAETPAPKIGTSENSGLTTTVTKEEAKKNDAKDKLLENMKKTVNVLDNISSYEMYKELNKTDNISEYYKYCTKIDINKSKGSEARYLCAKLARNLKNINEMENKEERKECCLYLSYWLYDQYKDIFRVNSLYTSDMPFISELFNIQYLINNESGIHDCYYYFSNNLTNWKEFMDLHYYFKNYENLKTTDTFKDKKEDGCSYFNRMKNLFDQYIDICCNCFTNRGFYCNNSCPHYFKCEKEYYPSALLDKLECNNETPSISVEKLFADVTVDHDVILKTQKSHQVTIATGNVDNESINDSFYTYVLSFLAFLGTFFLFFFFYKFTPMGLLIHKKGRKKKINNNFQDQYEQEYLERISRKPKRRSQNRRLHLAYHQA